MLLQAACIQLCNYMNPRESHLTGMALAENETLYIIASSESNTQLQRPDRTPFSRKDHLCQCYY